MSTFKEEFDKASNNNQYNVERTAPAVLRITHSAGYNSIYQNYDFALRLLTSAMSGSNGVSVATQPFSQLDAEVLEVLREKLIALGGKPPALPAAGSTLSLGKGM